MLSGLIKSYPLVVPTHGLIVPNDPASSDGRLLFPSMAQAVTR